MFDQTTARVAGVTLLVGEGASIVIGSFHPAHEDPNNHPAVFTEYANSSNWTLIHLGQFVGMAIFLGGLLALTVALEARLGRRSWLTRLGAVGAVTSLALTAMLFAVDGVTLKQAVDAWARASAGDQAAFFASAEVARWMEWGVRSYQSFLLGATLLLLAVAILRYASVSRGIGALMAVSGLAYIAQGWVLGVSGFATDNTIPLLIGYGTILLWSLWLLFLGRSPAGQTASALPIAAHV